MPFPETERFIYNNDPLDEVICQLRFPAILKISSDPPAKFQDSIREEYPRMDKKREGIPLELEQNAPRNLLNMLQGSAEDAAYEFTSRNKIRTVGLTNNFLALVSKNYEGWEDFKKHLVTLHTALKSVYEPPFYSRIGLRYKNQVWLSSLNLENTPWSELLQTHIAGSLSDNYVEQSEIVESVQRLQIRLNQRDSRVRLVHGLITSDEVEGVGYQIDADFFTDQETEIEDAFKLLDYFNEEARKLFRWCITDRLHEAFDPIPKPR